jgi:hypothetical protein
MFSSYFKQFLVLFVIFFMLILLLGLCSTTGDTAVATSPTGASPPSNICGTLTGQHSKYHMDTNKI